jgi:hypothetical protein
MEAPTPIKSPQEQKLHDFYMYFIRTYDVVSPHFVNMFKKDLRELEKSKLTKK